MIGKVDIYTDGACRGNPGPGGWGVLLRYQNGVEELLRGGELYTTNNRMELLAAIQGLEFLTKPYQIQLTTDSQYVKKGMTEWILGWKRRGWKSANKKPIKNQDLWQRLDQASLFHKMNWQWVRGHAGHVDNERADELANQAIDEMFQQH